MKFFSSQRELHLVERTSARRPNFVGNIVFLIACEVNTFVCFMSIFGFRAAGGFTRLPAFRPGLNLAWQGFPLLL